MEQGVGLNREDGGSDRGGDEDGAAPSALFHLSCTVNKSTPVLFATATEEVNVRHKVQGAGADCLRT